MEKITKAITAYIKVPVEAMMADTFEGKDFAVTTKELDEICGKIVRKFFGISNDEGNPTPDDLLDIMGVDTMELNNYLEDIRYDRDI